MYSRLLISANQDLPNYVERMPEGPSRRVVALSVDGQQAIVYYLGRLAEGLSVWCYSCSDPASLAELASIASVQSYQWHDPRLAPDSDDSDLLPLRSFLLAISGRAGAPRWSEEHRCWAPPHAIAGRNPLTAVRAERGDFEGEEDPA